MQYTDDLGEVYFSESLGEKYLSEKYGYPQNYNGGLPDKVKCEVRYIRILGDFQTHGAVLRSRGRVDRSLPTAFKFLVPTFEEYATLREYSKSSIRRMHDTLHTFFWYIEGNKIETLNGITAEHISVFIASKTGYSNLTVCRDMSVLRGVLKFLSDRGLSEKDLSKYVPRIKRLRNQTLPSYWDKEIVEKLLNSIDRGNPMGKPDYTMILLAVRYGIRSCDIANLKLHDIDWDNWQIALTLPEF